MKFTTHLELHSQTTRLVEGASHGVEGRSQTGFSPSMTSCSKEFRPESSPKHPLQITTRTLRSDFKFELLPLHSPLLRQSLLVSFPPLIDMLKFSGYPYLIRGQSWMCGGLSGGRARGLAAEQKFYCARGPAASPLTFGGAPGDDPQHRAGLEGFNDARTGMPPGIPGGAMCVQRFDDSLNSAIHITYRISLRSSSMPEPRDPLLKVLAIISMLGLHGKTGLKGSLTGARPARPTGGRSPAARQSNKGRYAWGGRVGPRRTLSR
jgi:hypothetical protein